MINPLLRTPSLSPDLIVRYERDAMNLLSFPAPDARGGVDALDALRSHYVVVDYCITERIGEGVGGIGPRSYELLLSAVDRQYVSFGGRLKWETLLERVATLTFGLVKNHPFYDTNKRTALLTLLYSLFKGGRYVSADKSELEDVLVYAAEDSLHLLDEFEPFKDQEDGAIVFLADYFRRNSREIDRRVYLITYRELDRRLRNYGYAIIDPDRNYAGVVRLTDHARVTRIGFPGWSRQVSKGDMRRILDACNLTADKGVDAQVFFYDEDPVFAFATEYRAQIASLAYR